MPPQQPHPLQSPRPKTLSPRRCSPHRAAHSRERSLTARKMAEKTAKNILSPRFLLRSDPSKEDSCSPRQAAMHCRILMCVRLFLRPLQLRQVSCSGTLALAAMPLPPLLRLLRSPPPLLLLLSFFRALLLLRHLWALLLCSIFPLLHVPCSVLLPLMVRSRRSGLPQPPQHPLPPRLLPPTACSTRASRQEYTTVLRMHLQQCKVWWTKKEQHS